MTIIIRTLLKPLLLIIMLLTLTACSVVDSYRIPGQPSVSNIPSIPEIRRQQTVRSTVIPPKKTVVRAPQAQVKSSSYQIKNPPVVISSKPQPTREQQKEARQRILQQAKKNATVNIDPYASIPENSSNKSVTNDRVTTKNTTNNSNNKSRSTGSSSPAIKTLMTSARADIAIGRGRSAISKLERGLRIEPQNAQLWHMLAKAHYSNSAYLHSISIAKKSNANTNDDTLINQNWMLIKQAGERSGNASAVKEALDYIKLNP